MESFALILVLVLIAGVFLAILLVALGRAHLAGVVKWAGIITAVGAIAVTALSLIDPLLNDRTTVAILLTPFQPHPAPGITLQGMTATIVGGGVDRATLTLAGLSWETRLLLVTSWVIQCAMWVAISWVAVRLASSLEDGDIFRDCARTIAKVASIVAVGGLLGSILGDLGAWRAGVEALEHSGGGADGAIAALDPFDNLAQYGWPEPYGFLVNIPFWPLAALLGLALIAAAFSAGHQLRQDTQGLV